MTFAGFVVRWRSDRRLKPATTTEHEIETTNIMPAKISLIGKRYARLVVIAEVAPHVYPSGDRRRKYLCQCDCGSRLEVDACSLKSGNTKSCGCLQKEKVIKLSTKHGHAERGNLHPDYNVWRNMTQRCTNPNVKQFRDYGGRGIKVCERWLKFENFLEDMGPRPKGLTLERIKNDLGYSKENCKWDTRKNQGRNQRSNVIYTVQGITGCVAALCEHFGLSQNLANARIHQLKWSVEDAFLTPVKTRTGRTPVRV